MELKESTKKALADLAMSALGLASGKIAREDFNQFFSSLEKIPEDPLFLAPFMVLLGRFAKRPEVQKEAGAMGFALRWFSNYVLKRFGG